MNRYRMVCSAVAGAAMIALLFPWSAPFAADTGGRGKPAGSAPARVPTAGQTTPGGGSAGPLKGVIHLSPGSVRTIGTPVIPAIGIDQLGKKFDVFSGDATSYESGAKAMLQVAKECSGKAYTVQDQQAAGCTGSETLNQCMEKLYKHCVQTYSAGGGRIPGFGGVGSQLTGDFAPGPVGGQGQRGDRRIPTFSTKQFQETAKTTAAEARVLSQLLNQYANEVEQKAKSLVP